MARLHHITTPNPSPDPQRPAPPPHPLAEQVAKIINLIRPAVQADGGDIEFVAITPEQIVQIRMHGACVGCPSSSITLQSGIERNLKEHIPQIRGVQAID